MVVNLAENTDNWDGKLSGQLRSGTVTLPHSSRSKPGQGRVSSPPSVMTASEPLHFNEILEHIYLQMLLISLFMFSRHNSNYNSNSSNNSC